MADAQSVREEVSSAKAVLLGALAPGSHMEYSKISVSVVGSVSFSDARTGNLFQRFLPGSSCRLSGSYHCDFVPSSQLVSVTLGNLVVVVVVVLFLSLFLPLSTLGILVLVLVLVVVLVFALLGLDEAEA
ncbi:hypothetical protein L484_014496 [Morus notabilis]|uniref:Uncharacterized protein n=1 Tax=Morus notabilis TaxID=981085 RepID=W9RYS5_9ROSA|nr:hypothetical protein L484_014496 [Morus notabilis]